MIADALLTSNSDEWSTPQDIFDELDAEFDFDLDPCATDENHKCLVYFTKEEDGLKKSWGGGAECSVIRRIARSASGLKRPTMKESKTTQLLFC